MVALLAGLAVAGGLAGCDRPGFDVAAWARERGNYSGENRRGAMVAALGEAGIRAGTGRDRVRGLLGEPDASGPDVDVYYLGRSRIGPHFETLRLAYDGGRMRGLTVHRD
ncbi:MAG: hypothetical protein PGN34_00235 [Methylobacterium frigidaeris]